MQFLGLLVALALMLSVTWAGTNWPELPRGEPWLLALGFILLASFLSGQTAKGWKLPKITGYLMLGVIVGPEVLGLVDKSTLQELSLINGLAVALIAMSAGGELKFSWLASRIRQVATIAFVRTFTAMAALALLGFAVRGLLPASMRDSPMTLAAALLLLAVVGAASSPMVTIALISETRSKGPLSRLILVVTVFEDICIVLFFTVALELARAMTSDIGVNAAQFAQLIGVKILGSALFGVACAVPLVSYCRRVGHEMPAVVIGVCLFIAVVGEYFGFEPLLAALALGCYVENAGAGAGHRLIQGIERTSLPVYCLFFALAGVGLHLKELADAAVIIGLLVSARLVGVIAGANLGGRLAGIEPEISRRLWTGLISQAGMALAMASIVALAFPTWGSALKTLLVAMITVNEVIGPIVFHWMLRRSGEAGRALESSDERPAQDAPPAGMPA